MMVSFGLLALAMATAPVQDVTDFDRFQLFNNCEPMGLVVGIHPDGAADIDLTEERVQFAVESRLRGARLFKSDPDVDYLFLSVNVVGAGFSVLLKYNKKLLDPASGIVGVSATWDNGKTGTHGGSAEFVVSSLSGLLDKFLTEYLRVNESACTESPQPSTQ